MSARLLLGALLCGVALAGCARGGVAGRSAPGDGDPRAQVRFRPAETLPVLGPDARVDRGLRAAAEELAAGATREDARLEPVAVRVALARAGYPGDARFVRVIGPKELPDALLAPIPRGAPVDVGWAWRDLPDGRRWWVLGWAPRAVTMDPVPRDLPLDGAFALRAEGVVDGRLLVASPDGDVSESALGNRQARWVARFHEPGEHRVEVIDGDRVALLFSVFVEAAPPAPPTLPGPATPLPVASESVGRSDPASRAEAAEAWFAAALDALRDRAGLPRLAPFPAFAPHARAHAACLATGGILAHATPRCPGVAALARRTHYPWARHHEDVAAAETAPEAWARVLASPGHLQNLQCAACTHVAIGVAADPSRLFVTLELLEFPAGEPVEIPPRR
jgi:uncharacterized protein YkwD